MRFSRGFVFALGFLAIAVVGLWSVVHAQQQSHQPMVYEGRAGGARLPEEGQPFAMVHPLVEDAERLRKAEHGRPNVEAASTASDLSYRGGVGGIGVETAPKVYLVLWGSQWNGNDPSGEAAILQSFYLGRVAYSNPEEA